MRAVGYTDALSVTAGARISLHVSCEDPNYGLSVVRLRHGDLNPNGPGFRASRIESAIDGTYPGVEQPIRKGSWICSESAFLAAEATSLSAWVWPTTPTLDRIQYIVGVWDERGEGFGLALLPGGVPALISHGADTEPGVLARAETPLKARTWHFLAASSGDEVSPPALYVWTRGRGPRVARGALTTDLKPERTWFAAAAHGSGDSEPTGFFNGKLGQPRVYPGHLTEDDVRALAGDESVSVQSTVDWDLSRGHNGDRAFDVAGNRRHGVVCNLPERAVTGWNWSGSRIDPALAPDEYGAIWFHDDDLDDAQWESAAELAVPQEWESGIYAFRLDVSDGEFVDHVPFIVRRAEKTPASNVLFLAPTFSWLAYAQDHAHVRPDRLSALGVRVEELIATGTPYEQQAFRYILENDLCGLYDEHTDGSGVHYSSRRRPIPNMRPGYNKASSRFRLPHQLNSDLYVIDWMDELQFEYDVASDEDLHELGAELLLPYRVLVTGTHPEYWSAPMLDALVEWLGNGTRLMYLGGNGFYWVTSVDSKRPHVIEVRRRDFPGATAAPLAGEGIHSTTGEPGGTWAQRGRPPEGLTGVGTCAIGWQTAAPYRLTSERANDRAAFAFEGVSSTVVGEYGLHLGAAGGWEVDSTNVGRGTPDHALVLGVAIQSQDDYQVINDRATTSSIALPPADAARAEMVFFETASGGAVFSVGSISYAACLSHDGYTSDISRITSNVLTRFADPRPFDYPEPRDREVQQ